MNYGVLINKLNTSGFDINRKMLADLAVREPDSFKSIVEKVKNS
jgi:large subunit ribosomal protein L20